MNITEAIRAHLPAVIVAGCAVLALFLILILVRRRKKKHTPAYDVPTFSNESVRTPTCVRVDPTSKRRPAASSGKPRRKGGYSRLAGISDGKRMLEDKRKPKPEIAIHQVTDTAGTESLQSGREVLQGRNLLDDDVFAPDGVNASRKFASVIPTQDFADGESLADLAKKRAAETPQTPSDGETDGMQDRIRQIRQEIDPQSKI